jgi:hypothetical protein
MTNPQMTTAQRAQQFWSVLVFAAREQKILTYKMLSQLTGMAAIGVGEPLGHVAAYCLRKDLPLLNIIAVSEATGRPEAGFLRNVPVLEEQARVFARDWLSHGAPSVEDLGEAFSAAQASGAFQVATT